MELHQHQGDGIRYSMHLSAPQGGCAQMLCDPSGNWVSWKDYENIQIESEEYRLKLRDAGVEIYALKSQVAFLIDQKESGRISVEARLMDGMSEKNKEIARLKTEIKELKNQPDPLTAYLYAAQLAKDEMKRLKAEVERLRKAGDAMAKRTEFFQKRWDADELCQEVEDWNAAKEGKQS